jgi:hypothetical protein
VSSLLLLLFLLLILIVLFILRSRIIAPITIVILGGGARFCALSRELLSCAPRVNCSRLVLIGIA